MGEKLTLRWTDGVMMPVLEFKAPEADMRRRVLQDPVETSGESDSGPQSAPVQ